MPEAQASGASGRPALAGARPRDAIRGCMKLLSQCRRDKRWIDALHGLQRAGDCRVELDTICYNVAMAVCDAAGQWQQTLYLLQVMETKGPRPSVVSYSSVCSALRGLGDWANALQLLKRAQEQQVQPDEILLCSVISACEKSAQWQLALQLARSMHLWSLETSTAAYNAVISTTGGLWEKSVNIYEAMQSSGLQVDLISVGATMRAVSAGLCQRWPQAFALLLAANKHLLQSSVVAFGVAAAAAKDSWPNAMQLLPRSPEGNTVGKPMKSPPFG
ncbi:unnamed protein product [Cladocopium goreaui]|uniref:Pentatricopeptide repeat-containing protein At1g62590 n=1 Tax=Cladocopium goreaui TaxID=2562237 RepID=A0A9P1GRH5_9DINO|nr:unnamed protein product [Cladocopium goreaui]